MITLTAMIRKGLSKMKKRVISILLCLGLLLSLLPLSATPAGAATLSGSIKISDMPNPFGDLTTLGLYWNRTTKTLTLRDLTLTGSLLLDEPVDYLVLEGANTIQNYEDNGGINATAPNNRLTIKGSGSLALTTNKTNSGMGIYSQGTVVIDGSDGCKVTITHGTLANPYAINIEGSAVNSLEVLNGGSLIIAGSGVEVSGRVLVDGEKSYMSVTTSRTNIFNAAVYCGMMEIKNKGEVRISESGSGSNLSALYAFTSYAGSGNYAQPGKFALRVDGGTLYASGSFQGAYVFGNAYIGNGADVTFYSLADDALFITGDIYFDKDYCFYAAARNSTWLLGSFAFRLTGKEYILDPGSPKVYKGSRYYSTSIDMDILPSYSYFSGIWLGLLSKGWVMGGGSLLKRFKIVPKLMADECTIPGTLQVGTLMTPYDFDAPAAANVRGGVPPYTYTFYGPSWMVFDPATGIITGTPTAPAEATTAMVVVTDNDLTFGKPANSLNVIINVPAVTGPPLKLDPLPDIPERMVNEAVSPAVDVSLKVSGGTAPYVYSMTGAPDWLTINPTTGVISGKPTEPGDAVNAVTVTVKDSAKVQGIASQTIKVGAVLAALDFVSYGWGVPSSDTNATILPINVYPGVSGGMLPYKFSISGVPTGWTLVINEDTGVITGKAPANVMGVSPDATVKVTDKTGNSKTIPLSIGAVSIPAIISDLTFFKYPEFDVPRTYPGQRIDKALPEVTGVTCSVRPVDINVLSAVSGGTPPYTFSISGPTWLKIVAGPSTVVLDSDVLAVGTLYGTPPANAAATTARITVTDNASPKNTAYIDIAVGPVSDLRFKNTEPGTDIKSIATGTATNASNIKLYPTANADGATYDGYHVSAGYTGTLIYVSANSATEKPATNTSYGNNQGPGWQHPHYGMIGGVKRTSNPEYDFSIIDGPEWLGFGLYGCFAGTRNSSGNVINPVTQYESGMRPKDPRPATTVTIRFIDLNKAEEVITLPVGPVVARTTDPTPAFNFTKLASYDIPARLLGTPIPQTPESPKNLDVSRSVTGVSDVTYTFENKPAWLDWLVIDPATGIITGKPTLDPGHVGPGATVTIRAKVNSGAHADESLTITISVGAVFTNYLKFEKPVTGYDIPQGQISTAYDPIDWSIGATGGVAPYTFSIAAPDYPSSWVLSRFVSNGTNEAKIIAGIRPATAQQEHVVIITVKDSSEPPAERSIRVVVGAVLSTPLVFVKDASFDIPAGVTGDPIAGVNVNGAVSGGSGNYEFSIASDASWLSIGLTSGVISGTRGAVADATTAVVTVKDTASGKTQPITIKVGEVTPTGGGGTPTTPMSYSGTVTIPSRQVGQAISPAVSVAVTGGAPGYTYQIVGPSWLGIDSTGKFTGVPTTSDSPKTATVIVTDTQGNTLTIPVNVGEVFVPMPLTFVKQAGYDIPPSNPGVSIGTIGVLTGNSNPQLNVIEGVSGGVPPYTFKLTVTGSTTDWDWLGITAANGQITGTPGIKTYKRAATTAVVRVTDSAGKYAEITISVGAVAVAELKFTRHGSYAIPASGTGELQTIAQNGYSDIEGGTTPYTYSIISGPEWITINSSTGTLTSYPLDPTTGTPPPVVVMVTDAEGLPAGPVTIPVGAVTGIPVLRFAYSSTYDIPPRVVTASVNKDVSGGVYGGGPAPQPPNAPVYTYSMVVTGGANGLSINPNTGVISVTGTVVPADATTAVVTVTDNATPTPASRSITINIGRVTPLLEFAKQAIYDIPASTRDVAIASVNVYNAASGGTEPYSFSMEGGPSWLSIDPVSGIITGTPRTETGATTAKIIVKDSASPQASQSFIINVGAVSQVLAFSVLSSQNVPAGTEGVAITPITSVAGRVTGGLKPYTFSISGPSWLSIDPVTGVLTGTRTLPSAATALITVVDSSSPPAARFQTIQVGAVTPSAVPIPLYFNAPSVTATPAGVVGMPLTPALNVSAGVGGGTQPYTYSISGPAWLSIDPATGVISGTPTAAAPATTATVRVTDAKGAYKEYTITVGAVTPSFVPQALTFLKFTGFDIPAGRAGDDIAKVNVSVGVYGGTPAYKFSKIGTWPSWLNLDPATGILSGKPTAQAAQTSVTIRVTDSATPTAAWKEITITVGAMAAAPAALAGNPGAVSIPGGTEYTPLGNVSIAGAVTGGYAPYTYELLDNLGWLSINSSTGVLSGTRPGATGATTATIKVTDSRGNSTTFKINIPAVTATPTPPPTPTPTPTPDKYIFTTKWKSTFWNWLMFILLFGWIWMWFINP